MRKSQPVKPKILVDESNKSFIDIEAQRPHGKEKEPRKLESGEAGCSSWEDDEEERASLISYLPTSLKKEQDQFKSSLRRTDSEKNNFSLFNGLNSFFG